MSDNPRDFPILLAVLALAITLTVIAHACAAPVYHAYGASGPAASGSHPRTVYWSV
jgi:hypothetical protein